MVLVYLHLNDPSSVSGNHQDSKNFLNQLMKFLVDEKLSIFGTAIFGVVSLYLLVASMKGNSTYGARTACFTYAPIT